jgi:uncharacterized phage protein (TIGR02218 family)
VTFTARETSRYSGAPYELFQFTTQDSFFRYTGADEAKIFSGVTFAPEAIAHTEPSQGVELKSGTLKVTVPLSNPVAQQFLAYMPSTPMFLTIYRAHDGDPDNETVVYWQGKVTKAAFYDYCELNCAPEQEDLKRPIPNQRYQPQCNRILFSPDCTVNKLSFRVAATLTSVNGAVIQAAAFATQPNGYFNGGYIELNNERRMILNHAGNTLTLIAPVNDLTVGTQVFAYPGCNQQFNGDCVQKFNNGVNFFGFEWIPTNNPFVGSIT